MSSREVTEGIQVQGVDESIAYTVDVSNWGDAPSNVSVVVKVFETGEDVTSTVMDPKTTSVSGNVITLSHLDSLTAGLQYRVEVQFDIGSNTFESYFIVTAEE